MREPKRSGLIYRTTTDNEMQADLVLAQYTCVALQRLGGSVKKVKGDESRATCPSPCSDTDDQGSLEDSSVRLPMDNIMFRRLRETIEHPCKSKDWYVLPATNCS